jgi:hypothetical protein
MRFSENSSRLAVAHRLRAIISEHPYQQCRLDRRAYQLVLVPLTLSRRSARLGTLRHLAAPLLGDAYSHSLAQSVVQTQSALLQLQSTVSSKF